MNAGMHKITAGDGYTYLTRQVAAERGLTLGGYYSGNGETPGRWGGRGLEALGDPVGRLDAGHPVWHVEAGSEVTEDQMMSLFGLGYHPNQTAITEYLIGRGTPGDAAIAEARLGRPFAISGAENEFRSRVGAAFREHNTARGQRTSADLDPDVKAQIRTRVARDMFAEEYDRQPFDDRELTGFIARESRDATTAVAGFDITFAPAGSVSVFWALADLDTARTIEDCHHRAVATAMEYAEQEAAFTRVGHNGVAQVDSDGLIYAMFDHRDSRDGDPHLHTHVPVANKVRSCGTDGVPRWRALDGQALYKANIAISEEYTSAMMTNLTEALGVAWRLRDMGPGKPPVWEIDGIKDEWIDTFSSRRKSVEVRQAALAKDFHAAHHREPTAKEYHCP